MAHIKESLVQWTTKRSHVFSMYTLVTCVRPPSHLSVRLHTHTYIYTRARISGYLLFCHRVVSRRRDTCKVLPPHCVAQNWPATCGDRVNREQERPLARRYARACLRNSMAVTCGKYDTMRRLQKPGGSKDCVLPENCGASGRFLFLHKKKTIVSGNRRFCFRTRSKAPQVFATFFKRAQKSGLGCH